MRENKLQQILASVFSQIFSHRHLPVWLENVNDANVEQQPLSFRITSWNSTHAGRTGRQKQHQNKSILCLGHKLQKDPSGTTHWSSESKAPFPRASPWMDSIAVQYRLLCACGRRWSGVTAPSDPPLSPEVPPPRSRQAWSILWIPNNRL